MRISNVVVLCCGAGALVHFTTMQLEGSMKAMLCLRGLCPFKKETEQFGLSVLCSSGKTQSGMKLKQKAERPSREWAPGSETRKCQARRCER